MAKPFSGRAEGRPTPSIGSMGACDSESLSTQCSTRCEAHVRTSDRTGGAAADRENCGRHVRPARRAGRRSPLRRAVPRGAPRGLSWGRSRSVLGRMGRGESMVSGRRKLRGFPPRARDPVRPAPARSGDARWPPLEGTLCTEGNGPPPGRRRLPGWCARSRAGRYPPDTGSRLLPGLLCGTQGERSHARCRSPSSIAYRISPCRRTEDGARPPA